MSGINTNYGNYGPQSYMKTDDTTASGTVGRKEDNASVSDETMLRFEQAYNKVASELGLPDLEDANLTPAEMQQRFLSSLGDKLASSSSTFRGHKVMFDIYALLDLMQEMSQKMRNALREVRQLENQSIQMNIKQQAEVQRRAAVCAAIAGAVVCLVQVGATAIVSGLTMKQMSTQSQLQAKSGEGVFSNAERMTDVVSDPAAAQHQLDTVTSKNASKAGDVPMEQYDAAVAKHNESVAAAKSEMDAAKTKVDEFVLANKDKMNVHAAVEKEQQAVDAAQSKVTQAEQELNAKTATEAAVNQEVEAQRQVVNELEAKVKDPNLTPEEKQVAQQDLDLERGKLSLKQQELQTAKQDVHLATEKLNAAKSELTTAQGALAAKKQTAQAECDEVNRQIGELVNDYEAKTKAYTDIKSNKSDIAKALQADVDMYAEQYKAARSNANMELEADGKISDATQAELDKAEAQFNIASAKQVKYIADMKAANELTVQDIADLKNASAVRFNSAHLRGMSAADQLKGQAAITKLQMWQTISMSLGQYGQQLVGSLQQLISANATELQAEQKMTEDQLDQIKDLFSQQLSVIQKTFEIFSSIISKESQTIEGIIRA